MKPALYQVVVPRNVAPRCLGAAIEAAAAAARGGFAAEVLVEDADRRRQLRWTGGVDARSRPASQSPRR